MKTKKQIEKYLNDAENLLLGSCSDDQVAIGGAIIALRWVLDHDIIDEQQLINTIAQTSAPALKLPVSGES